MKKTLLFFLAFYVSLFGQEKSKYYFKNETVTIKYTDQLSVKSFVEQSKHIPKSKNIQDYTESIYFNNFMEISQINAKTIDLNKKKTYELFGLFKAPIEVVDAQHENIFHSDSKYKKFTFENVVDNSDVELSYNIDYNNTRILPAFTFQDELDIHTSKITIICGSNVELGYKLYGLNTDKVKFTKSIGTENTIYTWEMNNIPGFEPEQDMQKPYCVIPHLVYFVKNLKVNGGVIPYLDSTKDLYRWYVDLVKQTNTRDQTQLKAFTKEIIKEAKTDKEKTKIIFEWVQKNLHYVAFEYAMGGYIPRDAVEVYEKKYGDCKDMANLLVQMFKIANIESGLTWIGTTDKPYSYSEITSPLIDNHMIASAKIEGIRYYFDATDKFCPFLLPSQMIQGKEALSYINEKEFSVDVVPVLEPKINQLNYDFDIKFNQDKIAGELNNTISGLNKSILLNRVFSTPNKENEIWNLNVTEYNPKINLSILDKKANNYSDASAIVKYNFTLDDWTKNIGNNFIFKPILLPYFSNEFINIDERKYDYNLKTTTSFIANYTYEIPEKKSVEFLPKNFKLNNTILDCELNYKLEKNKIIVYQNVNVKKVLIHKNEFELWNESLKQILKQSSQSILLKNEN
jgi:hypothetical protein